MPKALSISVFVPAHNEARNLEGAIRDIVDAAEDRFNEHEILLVDDGSTDGTGELADRLAEANPQIRVIHVSPKGGIARGYRTALALATKKYFAFLPGDREIASSSIKAIFEAVGSADLVLPFHANSEARPWFRRMLTWTSTTMLNTLFSQRLRYYQGPAVYPTELARALPSRSTGFYFLTEMLVNALYRGCNYVEVGLIHQERAFGKSKAVSLSNIGRALKAIAWLWWTIRVQRSRSVALTRQASGGPGDYGAPGREPTR